MQQKQRTVSFSLGDLKRDEFCDEKIKNTAVFIEMQHTHPQKNQPASAILSGVKFSSAFIKGQALPIKLS